MLLSEFEFSRTLRIPIRDAARCSAQVPTFGLRKNVAALEESSHHRDDAAALATEVVGVGG
jgi:hypothetical protein